MYEEIIHLYFCRKKKKKKSGTSVRAGSVPCESIAGDGGACCGRVVCSNVGNCYAFISSCSLSVFPTASGFDRGSRSAKRLYQVDKSFVLLDVSAKQMDMLVKVELRALWTCAFFQPD